MLRGSCCCGAIKFTLSSPPSMMGTCHCTRCRKSGASTFVFVRRESFKLLCGADAIATYMPEAPYKYTRCFCARCGTALGEITATKNPKWTIPAMDGQGVPAGIDVRKVAATAIQPAINTGIAHRKPGVGQVGAGVARAPLACFDKALRAFAISLGYKP